MSDFTVVSSPARKPRQWPQNAPGRKKPFGTRNSTKTKKRRKKGTLTKLKEELWQLCRQIIFKRYGNDCYTCDKWKNLSGSSRHCGHFITSSLCSVEVRYDLRNLRTQCYHCNINLAGNWVIFESKLRNFHGDAYVDDLKALNLATKGQVFPEQWFHDKITEYKLILESL